jgi:hypothetical protein
MQSRFACARRFCAVAVVLSAGVVLLPSDGARAAFIAFETPASSQTGGQPVDAQVSFTTSANTVQIVLQNDQADPKSATQCLSGLQFHLSAGQTSGTLTSSSGIDRTIMGNGSYSDGANPVSSGWLLQTVGSDLKLNDLGSDSPLHAIVGPPNGSNAYANGNPSIKNGPHNPHLAPSASFTLNVPGVTAASTVSSVVFQFNTSPGNNVAGAAVIPEPASAGVIGLCSIGACMRRRRR